MIEIIRKNLQPFGAQLIAVSKTKSPSAIETLYEQGQRHFGENYVQEILEKQPVLPSNICWHFIGHLQSNKVKYIATFVHLIHTLDSLSLLKEINKQAAKNQRIIDCLLQIKINDEETKFGLEASEIADFFASVEYKEAKNVRIIGVMGMATFTEDKNQVRREFQQLKQTFDLLKKDYFSNSETFQHISMGMSDDYLIALEEGSTMVRIGSLLFGKR
ncbi:MAG: YggS family pyridoxal phosphate-dependent enzyme [Bacteroidia bacterium]